MIPENTPRGTKVRYINSYHDHAGRMNEIGNALPKFGQIYTVREIVETQEDPGVLLLEIQNPLFNYDIGGPHEPCFGLHRFDLAE